MKRRFLIGAAVCIALLATPLILVNRARAMPYRAVELTISGPAGQGFAGSYTADGVVTPVHAVAPATLRFQAKEASFEVVRESGEEEFRVALSYNGVVRTSTTSSQQEGIRGRCTDTICWAETYSN